MRNMSAEADCIWSQSVTSPSKIEGVREFEADLSALFYGRGRGLDDRGKSKLSESPQNMYHRLTRRKASYQRGTGIRSIG